ncbi:uncharacterized protein [Procambarus clarkii]|uniref:uncharacterized protein n=1 Tax=Procambarus clarkii TaxID=6728 RepID=UPI001E676759|nr:uncharacterized protein LOC123762208 [Procambarus clarkii]
MGAGSSSSSLRTNVLDEIRSIFRILEDFEERKFDFSALGGMKTVYKLFHSSLNEIKRQYTVKDEELVSCPEKREVENNEERKPGERETTEPNLDSVINELDKLWEEEIALMDNAGAVFLLKLLCAIRLTLEKMLHKNY